MDVENKTLKKEGASTGTVILEALFPELYRSPSHRGVELLHDALVFGVALLFARTHLFFGMYPFAFALLAARRSRVVPALLGALAGAAMLGSVGGVFSVAYLLLFSLRIVLSLPVPRRVLFPVTEALFGERAGLRILSAALTGTALAAYELAVGGLLTETLFFAAAAVLGPTLLTLAFSGVYDTPLSAAEVLGRKDRSRGRVFGSVNPALAEISILALLVSLAFALRGISLFGLSFSTLYTVVLTLFVARRFGAARAGIVGLFLGLVGPVVYVPSYAILGVLSGLFFPYGVPYALLAGCLGAIGFSTYIGGLSGFLAVAPEAAVAVLFSLPTLSRLALEPDPAVAELERRRYREAAEAAARPVEADREHLARLSTAFSDLSGMFFRLSDESRRPAAAEYFVECEKVCARYCATCSNRVRCWEQGDRVAERSVYALANTLRSTGKISQDDLPPELRSGCPRIETILEEIRDECATLSVRRFRGDRNEFLSHDYAMLSKVLSDAARSDREESGEDKETAKALAAALGDAPAAELSVFGMRKKRIALGAANPEILSHMAEPLRELASTTLGCELSSPQIETRDGVATLRMCAVRRYEVRTATASASGAGGTSGDKLRFFETPEDRFYGILSDGMGTGEEAAATAAVSVDFLEAMLRAGSSRATALRMLNNLVRTREGECSASVDMLVFDLLYGNATFIKSGAAPSYIKRGTEIFRVRSRTMPLGLLKMPDAERINVEIRQGDVLVLLSDGIAPDNEDPAWLISTLATEDATDLDALANRIIAEAVSHVGEGEEGKGGGDDVTVGLVSISSRA